MPPLTNIENINPGTARKRYGPPKATVPPGDILPIVDAVSVFIAALIAALAYIQWLVPGGRVGSGVDLERMALLAAVVAPFILYEPRFGPAASRGLIGVLVRSHATRFSLLIVTVLALGQLSYILGNIPRTILVLWLVTSLLLTSLTRVLMAQYVRLLQRRGALTEVIAVVGAGPVADRLVLAMRQTRPDSVALLGVFDDAIPGAGTAPLAGTIDDLLELGKTHRIDWILLTAPPSPDHQVQSLVDRLKALSVPIGLCPQHVGPPVALRRIDCGAESVPVSILVDRPIGRFDRMRAAGEEVLPRWVVTMAMWPLETACRSPRTPVAAVTKRQVEQRAPLSLVIDDCDAIEFGKIAANFGQDKFGYAVTPNVDHMIRLHEDASFRALYASASYVLLDSQFLAHLVRLSQGLRLPVCTGSDLTANLFAKVIRADDRVVLVGGSDAQARHICDRYSLRGLVHFNPPMGFINDPQAFEQCLQFIESQSPFRFCLLAVGSPQQEIIARALQVRGAARGLALCTGASIDFLTGAQRRAPLWVQRRGMEWAFRLFHDPRRLARRYLLRGPRVFALIRTAQLRRRAAPTLVPNAAPAPTQ